MPFVFIAAMSQIFFFFFFCKANLALVKPSCVKVSLTNFTQNVEGFFYYLSSCNGLHHCLKERKTATCPKCPKKSRREHHVRFICFLSFGLTGCILKRKTHLLLVFLWVYSYVLLYMRSCLSRFYCVTDRNNRTTITSMLLRVFPVFNKLAAVCHVCLGKTSAHFDYYYHDYLYAALIATCVFSSQYIQIFTCNVWYLQVSEGSSAAAVF